MAGMVNKKKKVIKMLRELENTAEEKRLGSWVCVAGSRAVCGEVQLLSC